MINTDFKSRYIKARKSAIEKEFLNLNETQKEAVLTTGGPLLLLAGAGSGKTTVLINRIANIMKYGNGSDCDFVPDNATQEDLNTLEEYVADKTASSPPAHLMEVAPVEPWRIIAITFTNKAAGEMKERLERMLGPKAEDIWASTFHSACVRILRRDIDKLGYDKSFAIYDTSDCQSLMKRILKEMEVEEKTFPHRTVLGYISRAKDDMLFAKDFYAAAEKSGDIRRRVIGRAYMEYEKRMKNANALDFDDLILMTVQLFINHPEVLQHYQRRFKHVFVDEYQDTNKLQYLLASALAGGTKHDEGHGNICVVGDDDQSIYKFRGATIENILNFEKQFKNAKVIRLEQNYRSTGLILSAANDVIRNNQGRKGKNLWTTSEPGEIPTLNISSDERTEAQFVADKIVASASDGKRWSEHAVLYRMNAQSNQFETAFKRSGIPYRIFGGTGFFERAEIKDMLAYLCVIHNPHDDVRLLRIINNPPRGIGATTQIRLAETAAANGKSIFETIRESAGYENLKSSAGKLNLFANLIDDLRDIAAEKPLDQLYEALLEFTGYINMLKEKNLDENISRVENVLELKTNILSFISEHDASGSAILETGGTLFDFLSETALFSDLDRDSAETDRVMMMTIHSAKGLEFDTVFVVGAEEGVFPGIRSIGDPSELEEERRLCYVAMTRAMKRLYFTGAQRRMLFGKTTSAMPSRFIKEISADNIEVIEPAFRYGSSDFDDFGGNFSYGKKSNYTGGSRPTPTRPSYSLGDVSSQPASKNERFRPGDFIDHSAFGKGVIKGSSPAGGDALLEIEFENGVTKRVLEKSAARYMEKINA